MLNSSQSMSHVLQFPELNMMVEPSELCYLLELFNGKYNTVTSSVCGYYGVVISVLEMRQKETAQYKTILTICLQCPSSA
jgi:hypothetical protein